MARTKASLAKWRRRNQMKAKKFRNENLWRRRRKYRKMKSRSGENGNLSDEKHRNIWLLKVVSTTETYDKWYIKILSISKWNEAESAWENHIILKKRKGNAIKYMKTKRKPVWRREIHEAAMKIQRNDEKERKWRQSNETIKPNGSGAKRHRIENWRIGIGSNGMCGERANSVHNPAWHRRMAWQMAMWQRKIWRKHDGIKQRRQQWRRESGRSELERENSTISGGIEEEEEERSQWRDIVKQLKAKKYRQEEKSARMKLSKKALRQWNREKYEASADMLKAGENSESEKANGVMKSKER